MSRISYETWKGNQKMREAQDWSLGMRQLNIDKVLAMLKERDALITELADMLEEQIPHMNSEYVKAEALIQKARER